MTLPRFYPILDTALLETRNLPLLDAAQALLDPGTRILQFRHKTFWTRHTLTQLQRLADLCHSRDCLLIVNDRADFASLVHAGLHVGQSDLPPSLARRVLGDQLPLGFSTHNRDQLLAAQSEPATYLALGPIFPTLSKANPDPTVGLEQLRLLRPLTPKPLVAIGGITLDTAPSVLHAGADTIAVISDLFAPGGSLVSISRQAEAWIRTLDS